MTIAISVQVGRGFFTLDEAGLYFGWKGRWEAGWVPLFGWSFDRAGQAVSA